MLALVEPCKQWRNYVEDAKSLVKIITNNANLRHFTIDKSLNQKKDWWFQKLSGLHPQIKYRPWRLNLAGAPSWRLDYEDQDIEPEILSCFEVPTLLTSQVTVLTFDGKKYLTSLLDQSSEIKNYTSPCNDLFGTWNFTFFAARDNRAAAPIGGGCPTAQSL